MVHYGSEEPSDEMANVKKVDYSNSGTKNEFLAKDDEFQKLYSVYSP